MFRCRWLNATPPVSKYCSKSPVQESPRVSCSLWHVLSSRDAWTPWVPALTSVMLLNLFLCSFLSMCWVVCGEFVQRSGICYTKIRNKYRIGKINWARQSFRSYVGGNCLWDQTVFLTGWICEAVAINRVLYPNVCISLSFINARTSLWVVLNAPKGSLEFRGTE